MLRKLGIPFQVIPSRVSEASREKNPRRLVVQLAKRKAVAVAARMPKAVVIGSDTIVVCKGEIIGKPKNHKDSERILRLLSGRWQRVYTGVAVAIRGGNRVFADAAVTRVRARKLSEAAISSLIGKHPDKAGAYAVQDRKDPFIEIVDGDLDTVIGLSLRTVRKLLREARR